MDSDEASSDDCEASEAGDLCEDSVMSEGGVQLTKGVVQKWVESIQTVSSIVSRLRHNLLTTWSS